MVKFLIVVFVLMPHLLAEVHTIDINSDGQIGINVDETDVIPSGVDILLKGSTQVEGTLQLPVMAAPPQNPKDGMVFIHTSGEVRYFVSGSWYKLSTEALPAPLQAESGSFDATQTFQTVTLNKSYINPVVVTTPINNSSNPPVVVRIDHVTSTSFDIKVQRIDNSVDVLSNSIPLHFLVIEEGVYTSEEHGVKLEAKKVSSLISDKTSSWNGQPYVFQQVYTSPVVLGQVMSHANEGFSQFWCYGSSISNPPSPTAISVGKHRFSSSHELTEPETLGVIIIEAGSGTLDGLSYNAGVGADIVLGVGNGGDYNYEMPITVNHALLSQVAMDGGDGGFAVHKVNPQGTTTLKPLIDECQTVDSERSHTSEQVSYLVFE